MVAWSRFLQSNLGALLCGLVVILAPSAFAGEGVSPYLGIYGGMTFDPTLDNVEGHTTLGGFSFSDLDLKQGPMVGAKFGLMFGKGSDSLARWFGVELDGSYIQPKIKQQTAQFSGFGMNGSFPVDKTKVELITGAIHFLAKYPEGPVQPYVGAGPAIVHAQVSESNLFSSGNTLVLGLSAIGGFRVMLSEHVGLFAEYKYIQASLEFDNFEGDASVHAAVGGFNYAF